MTAESAQRVTAAELVVHLPPLCTIAETAEALRTHATSVYRWIRNGRLTSLRIVDGRGKGSGSGRVLVPRAAIERLLAEALR